MNDRIEGWKIRKKFKKIDSIYLCVEHKKEIIDFIKKYNNGVVINAKIDIPMDVAPNTELGPAELTITYRDPSYIDITNAIHYEERDISIPLYSGEKIQEYRNNCTLVWNPYAGPKDFPFIVLTDEMTATIFKFFRKRKRKGNGEDEKETEADEQRRDRSTTQEKT